MSDLAQRRYVFMQVEMALSSAMSGVPLQEAIRDAIESAMEDQARLCDLAGAAISVRDGARYRNWYTKRASPMIRNVRPGIGIGDETPMSSIVAVKVFSGRGGPSAQQEAEA